MDDRAYPQEETTVADRPATPIENAMMNLEREEGELFEAVGALAHKLERVLRTPYNRGEVLGKAADEPSKDVDRHSGLVRQIDSCKNRTRSTREVIEHLLKNLEV